MLLRLSLFMSLDAHMDALLLGVYLEVDSLGPWVGICSAVVDSSYTWVVHFVESCVHHFTDEEIGAHRGYRNCPRSHS